MRMTSEPGSAASLIAEQTSSRPRALNAMPRSVVASSTPSNRKAISRRTSVLAVDVALFRRTPLLRFRAVLAIARSPAAADDPGPIERGIVDDDVRALARPALCEIQALPGHIAALVLAARDRGIA